MKTITLLALSMATVFGGLVRAADEAGAATRASQSAARHGSSDNRWRYVWHNDRWWYWTSGEQWSYFAGRRWVTYDPRPSAGALSGYRRSPAFERPPAVPPRPPTSLAGGGLEPAEFVKPSELDSSAARENGMLGGGTTLGGRALPPIGGANGEVSSGFGGEPTHSGVGRGMPGRSSAGADRTGGGGFGGPKGGSLGGGSAAGGASTPQ